MQDDILPVAGDQSVPDGIARDQIATRAIADTIKASDPLVQASDAISRVLPQTMQNPNSRLAAIAEIRANYIKVKYGM